jgi:hypothetical protein
LSRLYSLVARRAAHRCEYCLAPESIFNVAFEIEHIVPAASGGSNDLGNLALACRSCNLFKGAATSGRDPLTENQEPLFDPRSQTWMDHFGVEISSGEIFGITPIGRATVEQLRVNRQQALTARRLWIAFGCFPEWRAAEETS